MKKILIFLIGIVSFLGINTVSADEIKFQYHEDFDVIQSDIDTIGIDKLNEIINNLINKYETDYSDAYQYFYIFFSRTENEFRVYMTIFKSFDMIASDVFSQMFTSNYNLPIGHDFLQIYYSYNLSTDILSEMVIKPGSAVHSSWFVIDSNIKYYNPYSYYYSNFNFYYYGNFFTEETDNLVYLNPDDTLYIPSYDDPTLFSVHKANSKFFIEPYYKYDGNTTLKPESSIYVEINLNEYPYVALSLKDYTQKETFYSNVYVKGNYCITPVYNYGMTERKYIITGSQVQRCSTYYNDFTSVRTYILKQDIENHAIYYLKAYDTTKENIIKVDTSVFDITYITEDIESNPYVNITGKTYPTIAYDKLTDTATKSEDEDYISGVSCQVGDFNCYNEYNNENIFKELFDKPLEILKSIFNAVSSIFVIITEFISLLPEAMQGFLYLSFSIAIILGLIKIIL